MRLLIRLGLGLVVLVAVLAAAAAWLYRDLAAELPDIATLRQYQPPVVSSLWSRDGVLMAEFFEERRKVVAMAEVPQHVVAAFLAAEDSHFFAHEGLDFKGILRAAITNLKQGRVVQGGSTITQQVAKSLLLSPERSFRRKFREAILATRIEKNLSKQEILYLYLNQIYLGHGAYGVEAASEVYFGISSRKLSVAQAALLAGLPQAPSRYDPYRNPDRCRERRRYVLERMQEEGWLDADAAALATAEPLALAGLDNHYRDVSPYFSEQVRRLLEERHGSAALLRGGLRITATMDSRLQAAGREALRRGIEQVDRRAGFAGPRSQGDPENPDTFARGEAPSAGSRVEALVLEVSEAGAVVLAGGQRIPLPAAGMDWAVPHRSEPGDVLAAGDIVLCDIALDDAQEPVATLVQEPRVQGALVALDAHTGEVLACVGGYDFSRSQFNRAVQAMRQPGSAMKPLIYAAAVDAGYTPATLVYDAPIVYDSPDLDEKWKPRNYSERFYGATTLREALVRSRNVVTIKVLRDLGVGRAVRFLEELGIRSPLNADLSLALGASAMPLLELVSAYTVFPGAGVRRDPVFVLEVLDRQGEVQEAFVPEPTPPVLRPAVAYVLTHMMQAVIREGTGRRARGLERPSAGKTGTTNNNRDAWFMGFTPDLVTGVWIGYDNSEPLGRGETGGKAAAPIWLEFMRAAVADRPQRDFQVPEQVEFARIDAQTGLLAGPGSAKTFTAAFVRGTVPQELARPESATVDAGSPPPSLPRSLDALR